MGGNGVNGKEFVVVIEIGMVLFPLIAVGDDGEKLVLNR